MSTPLLLDPGHAALTQWRELIDGASITLSTASADAIAAAQAIVDDIVAAEHVPGKFLEAILTQLRKRGLLVSRRGPAGGFMLARAPETITLAEVIRTLDGPFAPTPCARTRNPVCCEGCDDMKTCRIRPYMREVRDAMAKVWEERTIRDLADGLSLIHI